MPRFTRRPRGRFNEKRDAEDIKSKLEAWQPKTALGKKVKSKEITDLDTVLSSGQKILEPEIVDTLLSTLEVDYFMIGQSKGKFGGGKRRIFKNTQKKTAEGNKPGFAVMAVVGNKDGYVGVGLGKARETLLAKEKAVRIAKQNILKLGRGCGAWECGCGEPHSLPFIVTGKCGSVSIKLIPAPKGTGLATEKELKKLFGLAGYKDVWSKSWGQTRRKINMVTACMEALRKTVSYKHKLATVKYGSVV